MSTIVLAWELGGGYGHMLSLSALGDELRTRGHEVVVVARSLHRAEAPFGGLGLPIVQAPLAAPARKRPPTPLSVGETLCMVGYDGVENLGPLYRAWRVLLESIGASLVIGDFAPTAGLAARGLGIPRVAIGTGYTVPPLQTPMSPLAPWDPPPRREDMIAREGQVLGVVNRVLTRCGDPPATSLADLHDAEERFLLSFPELDHFGPREDTRYWGTLARGHGKHTPQWPDVDGPRVFAYVSARYWGFARLIDHLAHVGHPTVVYARDLDAELAESLTTATLRFSPRMVALDAVSEHAELVVGHGGHGTTATALLGARPVLVLPEHGEQALLGHRLSSQNLGIDVGPRKRVEHDYAGLAERMLADPTFADAARHFAADHEQHDQRASIVEMASVCEALLRR